MLSRYWHRFQTDRRWAAGFAAVLLCAVGFLLYANTFANQLFWDDFDGIVNNVYIRDWSNLPKFFSQNLIAGAGLVSNYWRPLLLIGYALEWHVWGDVPAGYHLTSLAIHLGAAFLVYLLLERLFRRPALALLTALVFLAHPLQTEAVTYVSGRGDPLALLLMVGSILAFLRYRDSGRPAVVSPAYWLGLSCFVLALLTKETAIALPALLALAAWFAAERAPQLKKFVIDMVLRAWPHAAVLGTYVALRLTVLNFNNILNVYGQETVFTQNFHVRLFTFFKVMTIYAGLMVAPMRLYMERTVDIPLSFFEPRVMAGAALCVFLLVLTVRYWRSRPVVAFGLAWFFLRILPNANLLVPNSGLLYEHWLYSPLIGLFLAFFDAVLAGWRRLTASRPAWGHVARNAGLTVLVIFLIGLSVRTVWRNQDWRGPIVFYEQTLRYARPSYRVLNNLGMAYDEAGRYDEARSTYERAVALDSGNPVAHHNLGNQYRHLGRLEEAVGEFETALAADANFLYSYRSLASLYLDAGRPQDARAVLGRYRDRLATGAERDAIESLLGQLSE